MARPSAFPWWLWPNVLGLDAPAVAVVWQRFLAGSFGVALPAAASPVLALVVWGIYLGDRWLDARTGTVRQPRHRFAARFPGFVSFLAVDAFLAAACLAYSLPVPYLIAGGIVAALVVAYLALVHVLRSAIPGRKELLVGLLFAAGVAVPLLASSVEPIAWLPAAVGFGLLCWLSCRLIDRWEEKVIGDEFREAELGTAVVLCAIGSPRAVGVALAVSVALLAVLHLLHHRTGPRLARVLADAALLTPLAVWAWP